nr:mediator of RNA polymerase II transcription subunit 1 [Ipomoea batatas]
MGDSFTAPQLSTTTDAFNCKKQLAGNEEFATLSATTNGGEAFNCKKQLVGNGYITQEEFVTISAITNGGDTLNCKKHVGNCELCLEEEEIAFLRSLGWEENGDEDDEEGDLTEEEIATFYTYASNHILQLKLKPKPALRYTLLHHNTAIFSFST